MRALCSSLAAACFLTASAHAELVGSPIYVEDFEGEIAFPLSPETDTSVFGGMVGYRSGDPLPLFPTVTEGELAISVQEANPFAATLRSSGAQVPIALPATAVIGLAARFDGYATTKDPTNGQFQTAAVTLMDSTLGNGASGYLLEFGFGVLRLAVSNLGPLGFSGYDDVLLTESAEDAIRSGDAFVVELVFDGTARTAQASLTVGVETFTTAPTTSDTFDAMDAIDAALVLNSTTNNAPPLATIASDVQQFSIHLPEPSGVAPALAGVAACGWLARRRRIAVSARVSPA